VKVKDVTNTIPLRWIKNDIEGAKFAFGTVGTSPSYLGAPIHADFELSYENLANGALMRVSPIGIFGANKDPGHTMIWAMEDALLTHPNPICLHINALYALMISWAIKEERSPDQIYAGLVGLAVDMGVHPAILEVIDRAGDSTSRGLHDQHGVGPHCLPERSVSTTPRILVGRGDRRYCEPWG
jgi:hypothetical protein